MGLGTSSGENARLRTATYGGGGIWSYLYGTVTLADSSSITDNTAGFGGGIHNEIGIETVNAYDNTCPNEWTGAISPNTPDDPPTVAPITCSP